LRVTPVTMPSHRQRQHAGGEDVAVIIDQALHVAAQITLTLQAMIQEVGIVGVLVRQARIDDAMASDWQARSAHIGVHGLFAADQDRFPKTLVLEGVGGADDDGSSPSANTIVLRSPARTSS
jgi:hypothetical protein